MPENVRKSLESLSPEQSKKLLNFQGYGNPAAPFWFIGMEEGSGGKAENLPNNLAARLSFSDVMDLREAHDQDHLCWQYWDENQPVRFPSVWINMARFVRALDEQAEDWADGEKAKAYIRKQLGRKIGKTFLTEVLPLPKRRATDWPPLYQQLFGFKSREQYEAEQINNRKALLKQIIQQHKPTYILAYGSSHHQHIKDIAGLESWYRLPETNFSIGTSGNTHFILSPFMGNGRLGIKQLRILIEYFRKN